MPAFSKEEVEQMVREHVQILLEGGFGTGLENPFVPPMVAIAVARNSARLVATFDGSSTATGITVKTRVASRSSFEAPLLVAVVDSKGQFHLQGGSDPDS
jgi:hypothetical protein